MQKDYDEENCDYIKDFLPDPNLVCKVLPHVHTVYRPMISYIIPFKNELLHLSYYLMTYMFMCLYYYIQKEKNAEPHIEGLVPAHLFAGSSLRMHRGARAPGQASSLPTHTRLDY